MALAGKKMYFCNLHQDLQCAIGHWFIHILLLTLLVDYLAYILVVFMCMDHYLPLIRALL